MAKAKQEELKLVYVDIDKVPEWERNHKRHDMDAIIRSIMIRGFKDPFKFEPSLNAGKGGIVEGNGRLAALKTIKELHEIGEAGYEQAPRGVVVKPDGKWFAPVLYGVNDVNEAMAEAYGIDHNNLVVAGADFSFKDMAKLWDDGYMGVVAEIGLEAAPVSMSQLDIQRVVAAVEEKKQPKQAAKPRKAVARKKEFAAVFVFDDENAYLSFLGEMHIEPDGEETYIDRTSKAVANVRK